MCKMWLARATSFVKAGKLFSHTEFLTLYCSCYTAIRMWIFLQIDHFIYFFFNEYCSSLPYLSLVVTHLARYSSGSYLSRDEDVRAELQAGPGICTANIAGPDGGGFIQAGNCWGEPCLQTRTAGAMLLLLRQQNQILQLGLGCSYQ